MKGVFFKKISFVILLVAVAVVILIITILRHYPFSVNQYKGITLGMDAPEKGDDHTVWAPPDDSVPTSDFYVYALGDESLCIGGMCGIGGYFVDCLGGWISGERQLASEEDYYGLDSGNVMEGKERVITVANADGKVVGIYPGAYIRNLPYILRNHRDLAGAKIFKICSDILPSRWR